MGTAIEGEDSAATSSTGATSSDATTGTTSGGTSGITVGTSTTDDSTSDAATTGFAETGDASGVSFISEPDGGGCGTGSQCDLWAQDCPEGSKCAASNWCGPPDTWSATKCVPVVADPGQPGEPCTIVDHCDLRSMCWDVDPESLTGVCASLCTGSGTSPVCDDPEATCLIANTGALIACVPACDPLEQSCAPGQGCHPGSLLGQFLCLPDGVAVGLDGHTPAACPAGSTDVDSSRLATCAEHDEVCCADFCDTFDPICGQGQTCVAIDEDGLVFANVGLCVDAV